MTSAFDAVLFDLFDTLCRLDETTYMEGKRRTAAELGLDPQLYFQSWLSLQDRCQRGEVADVAARIRECCRLLGKEVGPRRMAWARRHEEEVLFRCASLHDDALPILGRLRSTPGLRLGLVSNASAPARLLVDLLGLSSYFDVLVFSYEIGLMKPEKGIYQAASRSLSVAASRCLFVGDGNCRELEGAMALGMAAVRIERPAVMEPYRREASHSWDHSITDLRHLPDLPWNRHSTAGASDS
jgi:putative hydrolase of the HAD superfamily